MSADRNNPVIRSGLTEQQHRAVTTRDVSVALSAGAGCGKTFVLTERFLAELEPDDAHSPPRLGQLVAITFTERAAREMRDRIRAACRQRLLHCDANHVDYWQGLIRELDSARISTIHSFCGSLLRSHAVEAGLDPRFTVLDAPQGSTLLLEIINEELRSRLADRDEATMSLLVRFNLEQLRGMVARLVDLRQDIDWAQWRRETPEGLIARWHKFWQTDSVPRLLRQIAESAAAKTVLDLATRYPPSHPMMRERCDALRERLPNLPTCKDAAVQLALIREAAKVQGGGTKKNWISEDVYEQFKNAAAALREMIDSLGKRLDFDPAAARPAAETALQLLSLAAIVDARYMEEKQELSVLDFNDLLILARDLLSGPEHGELRRRMASQIRLLMVDEFQDTDPLQVGLVKALCDNAHLNGKLFFVGDYKQSIYRFRGADPQVFRQLREEIPKQGRLPLSLNFRSQPAVLDFVNVLFCESLGPEYEPLRPHRAQVAPAPAVEFLWAVEDSTTVDDSGGVPTGQAASPGPSANDAEMGAAERLRRREADWIARRIRAMLDAGEKIVWDDAAAKSGTPAARAVRQGDIALLFRALTNVEFYEEALQRYGVDYYVVGGHAFYAQQEVFDLLNLLRTLESPCDEVSLAGVLRSPMFSLCDETLLWLRVHGGGLAAGLFDSTPPPQLDAAQRRRAAFAAATLRELRSLKDRLPIAPLIHDALRRTGYDAVLLTEFLGERKLANLHKLIDQARAFDHSDVFTLADFITQLSEFVARQPDEALAATHPELADVVRLMSVHQAKGLEFPVTIVPDVARPRMMRGPLVAFTPRLGPMFKEPDVTTGYDLYQLAENEEDMAEHHRLLYVAATRAADYLILSSGVEAMPRPSAKRADANAADSDVSFKLSGPWMNLLASRFDLVTGRPKVELPAHDATPAVRVTMIKPIIRSKPVDLRRRRDLLKIVEKAQQMAADGAGKSCDYVAPVPHDPTARRQYSFSRLTGKLHARNASPAPDLFADESSEQPRLDPRGLGTLVHAVLAEVHFAAAKESGAETASLSDAVVELVQRHAPQHLPSAEPSELDEPIAMIQRFLASPRAAALASAAAIHREVEFLLPWPPEGSRRDGRYLQGFIDCLYCDADGQWRIIDYKTNRAARERIDAVAADYEMQMLVYALAAERILKCPPAEIALCFLRPGVEHHFAWDDAARRRVVEMVDRAMAE